VSRNPSGPSAPRAIGRRDALLAFGGASVGVIALAAPSVRRLASRAILPADARAQECTPAPALTEGPYHLENPLLRRNVIERRPGVTLWVTLKVLAAASCEPIPGATVEIWHADAGGEYSGFGGADNDTFMRGRQVVGSAGAATFRTVYPGWYPGRTPHIHYKVHVSGNDVHTGQLFFDEAVTDAVYTLEPYAARGDRDTTNAADGIFASGGAQSMLALARRGAGYWGKIDIAVTT
jgi:protocatechuate 3,4-dioxygenase beta subunit